MVLFSLIDTKNMYCKIDIYSLPGEYTYNISKHSIDISIMHNHIFSTQFLKG